MKKNGHKSVHRKVKKRHKPYRPIQAEKVVSEGDVVAFDEVVVRVKAPRPESDEAGMTSNQKRQQTLRKLGQQMADFADSDETFRVPGFTPYRITLDKNGRVKRQLKKMPAYFQHVLTMCKNLVHDPSLLPRLQAYCPAMTRSDVRLRTAEVLAVLLASTEFEGGRIGRLRPGAEMDTVSHYQLRKEYLLRFGREIDENTWHNAYERLEKAGYIQDLKVTLPVEVTSPTGKKSRLVRSAASYKQFTPLFFQQFKVTQFANVVELIKAGVAKMKKQGYLFKWVNFSYLAKRVRERAQANFLNQLIKETSPVLGTSIPSEPPLPY